MNSPPTHPTVFVVDDEPKMRRSFAALISSLGFAAEVIASGEELIPRLREAISGCAVVDYRLKGMDGIELHRQMLAAGWHLPVILVSAYLSVQTASQAMEQGIFRVLEKPYHDDQLAAAVRAAVEYDRTQRNQKVYRLDFEHRLESLSARERVTLDMIVGGAANKAIERRLASSTRTVDRIRASILEKMNFLSFVELSAAYGAARYPHEAVSSQSLSRQPCSSAVSMTSNADYQASDLVVESVGHKQANQDQLKLAWNHDPLHTQRLESLGILAASIAHDINNILAGVTGCVDLTKASLPASTPASAHVAGIEKAVLLAARLTQQILTYSRNGGGIAEPLDLSEVVEESKSMLAMCVSKKASLTYCLGPNLPVIRADATQLRQLLVNLVTNASEALGQHGGAIAIATSAVGLDTRDLARIGLRHALGKGFYVCLEVADTGCGMDQKTLARMFDPFFSSKPRGSGLGLAIVRRIVDIHKGAIQVLSEPREGSTFRVFFPTATHRNSTP